METNQIAETVSTLISAEQLLVHWQDHRRLTRKVIEAFPEDKFTDYAIGGMRPFANLMMEVIDLADGGISGIALGKWKTMDELGHVTGHVPQTTKEMLKVWDSVTEKIDELWPSITMDRFQQTEMAFGQYEGTVYSTLLYIIDNEIHHRGQAYVYLRSLGIAPPPFYER